jgi:hypothetical protein
MMLQFSHLSVAWPTEISIYLEKLEHRDILYWVTLQSLKDCYEKVKGQLGKAWKTLLTELQFKGNLKEKCFVFKKLCKNKIKQQTKLGNCRNWWLSFVFKKLCMDQIEQQIKIGMCRKFWLQYFSKVVHLMTQSCSKPYIQILENQIWKRTENLTLPNVRQSFLHLHLW